MRDLRYTCQHVPRLRQTRTRIHRSLLNPHPLRAFELPSPVTPPLAPLPPSAVPVINPADRSRSSRLKYTGRLFQKIRMKWCPRWLLRYTTEQMCLRCSLKLPFRMPQQNKGSPYPAVTEMLLTVVDVAAFPPEPPSATEVAPPYPCAPAPIIVILN